MRLFSKVFFSITAILCLALSLSGYLLMSASFRETLDRETERAVDAWRLTGYVLQSTLGRQAATGEASEKLFASVIPDILHTDTVSVFDEEGQLIYSEYQGTSEVQLPGSVTEYDNASVLYDVQTLDGRSFLTVSGLFRLVDHRLFLAVSTDVTQAVRITDRQMFSYRFIYIAVCLLSLFAVAIVTMQLVRPIERTAKSASRIAKGMYRTRVPVTSDDEIGDLAKSFNVMAHAVDKSVEALETSVAEKEDFVGNFAHELKTPLTSVIGYADMLTQKNLPEEQVKGYAQYILDEGLRLEALSYKLMELIVLNKQDFVLEELPARDILENVAEGILPLTNEKKVDARFGVDDAYLHVEFDLFKTMLLNIIDNAIKADATRLDVTGRITRTEENGLRYCIEVKDNGRGMPKEALSRITEAFYMVDKSRSRAKHGAGLGLALVKRITELHHAELFFDSEENEGTTVTVLMPLREEDIA